MLVMFRRRKERYQGQHRWDRYLTRSGWGPIRVPGENRRGMEAAEEARRIMKMISESDRHKESD